MSDSASIMPEHPPVTDWVNDFDHTDPSWTENPFPIWENAGGLAGRAPAVSRRYMPTTYQAVKKSPRHRHFSRRVIVRDVRLTSPRRPPITSDPRAQAAKQLLLPPFAGRDEKLEPRVRVSATGVDEFIADGRAMPPRSTKHVPVRAIAHMGNRRRTAISSSNGSTASSTRHQDDSVDGCGEK
jgi:hypothetical protein